MKDMNQKFKEYLRNEYTIERDGVKIALTPDEMRELKWLYWAREGFYSLECYAENCEKLDEKREKVLDKMMADYDICVHVADLVYEEIAAYSGNYEMSIVSDLVDDYKEELNV